MTERTKSMQRSVANLRMAATEMRRIADDAPAVAERLRHTAAQVEAETDDLARQHVE